MDGRQEVKGARCHTLSYNTKDLLIYALGIGCGSRRGSDLRYLYEGHEAFEAFPTFVLALPFKGTSNNVVPFPGRTLCLVPPLPPEMVWEAPVSHSQILHYDQQLIVRRPLDPRGGRLRAVSSLLSATKTKRGTLLRTKTVFSNEHGTEMAVGIQGTFLQGAFLRHVRRGEQCDIRDAADGDDGGRVGMGSQEEANKPPIVGRNPLRGHNQTPDAVICLQTQPEQALLYRLSGDYNALHVDPAAANKLGLQNPILHGLCSFGFAVRALLQYTQDRKTDLRLYSIRGRFTKPVLPGQRLQVRIWEEQEAEEAQGGSPSRGAGGSGGEAAQASHGEQQQQQQERSHAAPAHLRLSYEVWALPLELEPGTTTRTRHKGGEGAVAVVKDGLASLRPVGAAAAPNESRCRL